MTQEQKIQEAKVVVPEAKKEEKPSLAEMLRQNEENLANLQNENVQLEKVQIQVSEKIKLNEAQQNFVLGSINAIKQLLQGDK